MADPSIPPPPDGSGIVAVGAQDSALPPPPDGSGVAPDTAPSDPTPLSADDETALRQLYHTGSVADIQSFLHARGRSTDTRQLQSYVSRRDAGKPVNDALSYAGTPTAPSTDWRAAARGVAQGLTLNHADEIHGFLNGVGSLLAGGDYTSAYDNTVDKDRALDGADRQNNYGLQLAGNLAGGALLPFGAVKAGLTPALETVALRAGQDAIAAGATADAAKVIAARAVAKQVFKEGAVYGGVAGEGDGEGTGKFGSAALGAVGGAALGAALPYAASAVGNAAGAVGRGAESVADLATGSMAGRTPNAALQPFVDEGVPALAADVGGTGAKMATGAANMTLGGIPLSNAARRSVAAAQDLKNAIASRIGNPIRTLDGQSDSFGAGLVAQRGVKDVLGDGGTKETVGNGLYRAIPIDKSADASVANTQAALSDINAGLESNPELSNLISDPRMAAYQSAFTGKTTAVPTGILDVNGNGITRDVTSGGKLNWGDLQSFRSYIGELAGRPTLQSDTSQSALRQLYAGLSEDMRATAAGQGPDALAKFTRANNYWRALQTRRDEVLKPLLGNDLSASGADAFRHIERWSSNTGDVAALGRTLRSMPEEAANDVRATVFDRLGTVSKGRQDATGSVWSPNDFVTHWNGLSSRAKANLFPNADYRQSIDNLTQIASQAKAAQAYSNVSKTGNAVNGIALLTGFFTNPLGTLPVAMGELGVGKLLSSARFANWLGSSVKKPNPNAMLAHINRLTSIAKAEPGIAAPTLQLQQRLASAFQSAPNRAAAQQPGDGMAIGNGQNAQQQPSYEATAP